MKIHHLLLGIIVNITRTRCSMLDINELALAVIPSLVKFIVFLRCVCLSSSPCIVKKGVQNCHMIIYCVKRIEVDARVKIGSAFSSFNYIHNKYKFEYIKWIVCNCVLCGVWLTGMVYVICNITNGVNTISKTFCQFSIHLTSIWNARLFCAVCFARVVGFFLYTFDSFFIQLKNTIYFIYTRHSTNKQTKHSIT